MYYSDDPCKDFDRYLYDLDELKVCVECDWCSEDVIDELCEECRNNGK